MRPALELVWWGASELIDRLTHSAHAGRAAFWFGTPQFEAAWLDARNQEAVAALDTRYTPEHHVRVLSQDVLAAFAREPAFVERYYQEARKLWRAIRAVVEHPPPKEVAPLISTAFDAAKAACAEQLPRLGDGISLPLWPEACATEQKLQNAISEFSDATYAALRK